MCVHKHQSPEIFYCAVKLAIEFLLRVYHCFLQVRRYMRISKEMVIVARCLWEAMATGAPPVLSTGV